MDRFIRASEPAEQPLDLFLGYGLTSCELVYLPVRSTGEKYGMRSSWRTCFLQEKDTNI